MIFNTIHVLRNQIYIVIIRLWRMAFMANHSCYQRGKDFGIKYPQY